MGIAGNPGNWKVDPCNRQDRKPSTVKTYKLTPEEIEQRYGNIKLPEKKTCIKPFTSEEVMAIREKERKYADMSEKKNKKEILLDLCKEHGFGKTAYEKIGLMLGIGRHSVEVYVSKWGIKKLLTSETVTVEPEGQATKFNLVTEEYDTARIELQHMEEQEIQKEEKSKRTSFYIASAYGNKKQVSEMAKILKMFGWFQTYDWTILPASDSEEEARLRGIAEINGVRDCEIMIILLPGFKGTHTELGIALGMGKKVYIYAPEQDCFLQDGLPIPFYFHPSVTRVAGDLFNLIIRIVSDCELGLVWMHECKECGFKGEVHARARTVVCPKCGVENDFWLEGEEPPQKHMHNPADMEALRLAWGALDVLLDELLQIEVSKIIKAKVNKAIEAIEKQIGGQGDGV
jgi:hypothetical protein